MKHYRLTLPDNSIISESIVNGLNRGVRSGLVIPHGEPGDVTDGSVLEFDTADRRLQEIIEITDQAHLPGWSVEVRDVDADHGNPALN